MENKVTGSDYANLALAALIFGIGLSLFGVFAVAKSLAAKNWHTTEGRVVESKVIEGFEINKPYILYQYEVGGKSYTSDRISFLLFGGDSFAEKAVAAYPQNKIVIVHYDPANPAKSVVEPRLSVVAVLTLVAGVLCLGAWWGTRVKLKMSCSS
jgi:hypothetical protein